MEYEDIYSNIKIAARTVTALGMSASGAWIGSHFWERDVRYVIINKTLSQDMKDDVVTDRYTLLRKKKETQLFMEFSRNGAQGDGYLYDHLLEKQNATTFYYIVNTQNKNIRVSPEKPKEKNEDAYVGWKLNKFTWTGSDGVWYGYCQPEKNYKGENVCNHLPEGWKREEVVDSE